MQTIFFLLKPVFLGFDTLAQASPFVSKTKIILTTSQHSCHRNFYYLLNTQGDILTFKFMNMQPVCQISQLSLCYFSPPSINYLKSQLPHFLLSSALLDTSAYNRLRLIPSHPRVGRCESCKLVLTNFDSVC